MNTGSTDSTDDEAVLRDWLEAVARELDLPTEVVLPGPLLDVAKDVARGVVRPGAPTSTYLIGVALGLQLAHEADPAEPDADDVRARLDGLTARVQQLAARTAGSAGTIENADPAASARTGHAGPESAADAAEDAAQIPPGKEN